MPICRKRRAADSDSASPGQASGLMRRKGHSLHGGVGRSFLGIMSAACIVVAFLVVSTASLERATSAASSSAPQLNTLMATTSVPAGRMTIWVQYAYTGNRGLHLHAVRASFNTRKAYTVPSFTFAFKNEASGRMDDFISSQLDETNGTKSFDTGWILRTGRSNKRFRGSELVIATLRAECQSLGTLYKIINLGLILTPKDLRVTG